jgi:hypothetical protein
MNPYQWAIIKLNGDGGYECNDLLTHGGFLSIIFRAMLSVLRYYRVNTSRYCTHYQALTRLSAVVQLRRPAGEARSFSAGTEGAASTAAPIVSEPPMHRVCIVGSGPSGFYCAKYLLENKTVNVAVDVVEKLPVPFGTHDAFTICFTRYPMLIHAPMYNTGLVRWIYYFRCSHTFCLHYLSILVTAVDTEWHLTIWR